MIQKDLLSPTQDLENVSFPKLGSYFSVSDMNSRSVAQVLQSQADTAKKEIESYLEQKIQNQTLMIAEKFKKLEIVLEGKEAIKKLQTK
jgi:phage regulator Rha-like protein